MISMETPAKIFSCTQSTELANAIAAKYGAEIGKVNFHVTAMENSNLLLKNLFVVLVFF